MRCEREKKSVSSKKDKRELISLSDRETQIGGVGEGGVEASLKD